jgi:hypothetical protein
MLRRAGRQFLPKGAGFCLSPALNRLAIQNSALRTHLRLNSGEESQTMSTRSKTAPKRTRAEINRENAKKSTDPQTAEGKAALASFLKIR